MKSKKRKLLDAGGLLLFIFWMTVIACFAKDLETGIIEYGNGHYQNVYSSENRVERLNENEDWVVKYNPLSETKEGEFTIQPRDAMLRFNRFEGEYQWDSGKRE